MEKPKLGLRMRSYFARVVMETFTISLQMQLDVTLPLPFGLTGGVPGLPILVLLKYTPLASPLLEITSLN